MTSNNPAIEGRHQPIVVPLNLWLQWNGDGIVEDGEAVSEGDVTWCRDKIFDGDIEYVHADEIRRALMGHKCSELWSDNGLIAATMRCVNGYEELLDVAKLLASALNATRWDSPVLCDEAMREWESFLQSHSLHNADVRDRPA